MYSAEINEECSIRFNYRWPREQYAWALTFLLLTFRNELVQYSPISQSDDIELVWWSYSDPFWCCKQLLSPA